MMHMSRRAGLRFAARSVPFRTAIATLVCQPVALWRGDLRRQHGRLPAGVRALASLGLFPAWAGRPGSHV